MNSIDYYLINLICDFLLLLVIQGLYKCFFKVNDNRKDIRVITSVCWYAGTIIINELFHISILNLITNILFMYVMTFALYGKTWKKIVVTLLIAVLSAACDLLAYTIVSPILGEEKYYYSFAFTVVFMLIVERVIRCIVAKDLVRDGVGKELVMLCVIPLLAVVILYCITVSCPAGLYMTLACIAIVGICISSFIIYDSFNRNFEMKWHQKELENQIETYRHELIIMQNSDRKMQNMRHDLKNHLMEIRGLAETKNEAELIKYIDDMGEDISPDKRNVHTGKYEIDSLVNYLLDDAMSKGIGVDVDIKVPEDIEISYYKLNIVLGNLLENAIEAATTSSKKYISLMMKYDRGTLYLKIVNSFSEMPILEGDKLKTSKSNDSEHGIGLRSVRDIVEKQHGTMNIEVEAENRVFSAEVMMYI